MKNLYDDFQIISPQKMEEIAKKYYQELNSVINTPQPNFEETAEYSEFCEIINKVIYNLSTINKSCSPKFYKTKSQPIQHAISLLQSLNVPKQTSHIQTNHFCGKITTAIKDLTSAILLCLKPYKKDHQANNTNFIIHIETLLEVISTLSSCLGECRFRI